MDETIEVPVKDLKRLVESHLKLERLEGGGVDNWEGCEFAYNCDEDGMSLEDAVDAANVDLDQGILPEI